MYCPVCKEVKMYCPMCHERLDFIVERESVVESHAMMLDQGYIVYESYGESEAAGDFLAYACPECFKTLFTDREDAVAFLRGQEEQGERNI